MLKCQIFQPCTFKMFRNLQNITPTPNKISSKLHKIGTKYPIFAHGLTGSKLQIFYSFYQVLTKFLDTNVILGYFYYIFAKKREKWVFSDFQIFHKIFSFTQVMQTY